MLALQLGLLLLTTYAGLILLAMIAVFLGATRRGRRALRSADPWLASTMIVVVLFPHLIWLDLSTGVLRVALRPLVGDDGPVAYVKDWFGLFQTIVLAHVGLIILVALGSKWHLRTEEKVPVFVRSFTDPFARRFVYFFALAPGFAAVTIAALLGERQPVGGIAPHLVLSGLAIVVLAGNAIPWHRPRMVGIAWSLLLLTPPFVAAAGILLLPWTGLSSVDVSRPANAMGEFFSESFQRRTGAPLAIVSGDPRIAALVALGAPRRPSLYFDANPERSPWVTLNDIRRKGAVVLWPGVETQVAVPPEIVVHFPDLVPEVPHAFERTVQGRLPLIRIGWGVLRPMSDAPNPETKPTPGGKPGSQPGNERLKRLGRQRAVDVGLLVPAGGLQDFIANLSEQEIDLHTGYLDIFDDGADERAVAALAVPGDVPLLRRIGDERGALRLDLGEPLPNRAGRVGLDHGLDEWIVAAGVKDHQPKLVRAFDSQQHLLERNRLVGYVTVVGELGIDRHQIVDPVELHAVTRIVHDRPVGAIGGGCEALERLVKLVARQVELQGHGREADPLQGGGKFIGIVLGIGQPTLVHIVAVADHQRHPRLGSSGRRRRHGRRGRSRLRQQSEFLLDALDAFRRACGLRIGGENRLKVGKRPVEAAPALIKQTAIIERRNEFWIEPDRGVVVRQRTIDVVLVVLEGETALVQVVGRFGIEPDRVAEIRDGAVGVALASPHETALIVRISEIRVEPNGLVEIGEGTIRVALHPIGDAAIVECRGKPGGEADRLGIVGDRAVVIALVVVPDAGALKKCIGKFRINTDRLVEISDGAVDIALAFPGKGPIEVHAGVVRGDAKGFVVVGERMIVIALLPIFVAAIPQGRGQSWD